MAKNRSVVLGNYFEDFVVDRISEGSYKNTSVVIQVGLRLLEEHENKAIILRNVIQKGLESSIAENFGPENFLERLKTRG